MKQIIYMLMALIAIAGASAITVDCGTDSWWDWTASICRDYELQGEFNEVTGLIDDVAVDVDNLNVDVDGLDKDVNKLKHKTKKNKRSIKDLERVIDNNNDKWSLDSRGVGMSRVIDYLYDEFMSYLKTIFVTKDDFAVYEAIKVLGFDADKDEINCYAARLRSYQTGEQYTLNGMFGDAENNVCFQSI